MRDVESTQKISEMAQRIRQLEDALAVFQLGVSQQKHPLLNEEKLLAIKFGDAYLTSEKPDAENSTSAVDATGILSIRDGEMKYYGVNAGSEPLLGEFLLKFSKMGVCANFGNTDDVASEDRLSKKLLDSSLPSPEDSFTPEFANTLCESIPNCRLGLISELPPHPRALELCEIYINHLSWTCRPIKREELLEDLLTPIYQVKDEIPDVPPPPYHSIATLCLVFACAALFDLALPPHNEEAQRYYLMGKKALGMKPLFAQTDLETVQAVFLVAMYQSFEGHSHSVDSAWCVLSLACKLGQRVGA